MASASAFRPRYDRTTPLIRRPTASRLRGSANASATSRSTGTVISTMSSIELTLLRRGHLRRLPLGPQFEEGAAVILWRHLDEGGKRVVPVLEQHAGAGAAGEQMVALDQDAQALRIKAQRVAHAVVGDTERTLARPIRIDRIGCVAVSDRTQFDLVLVAQAGEAALRIVNVGDAARHAGSKIAAGVTDDGDNAAGHELAAVVAGAFDNGDGAGVTDR